MEPTKPKPQGKVTPTRRPPYLVPRPVGKEAIEATKKDGYVLYADRQKINAQPDFNFAEHQYLGDSLNLQWYDGTWQIGYQFQLPNGLSLSYGSINALAGDFYGTYTPISDGATLDEQKINFKAAWDTLAEVPSSKAEAEDILSILREEVVKVDAAIQAGQNTSEIYAKDLPNVNIKLEAATWDRCGFPGYAWISWTNFDHFGADARTAYTAGHQVALDVAARGGNDDLVLAYAMNAFADHFLEDSFSSGHMRTPRRALHSWDPLVDDCAIWMHDEDCALGLNVKSPSGQVWTAYGDAYAFDHVDKNNKNQCFNALRASVSDIYNAWKTGNSTSTTAPLSYAPTLASASSTSQYLAPLFTILPGQTKPSVRKNISDRRTWSFSKPDDWWALSTIEACRKSKLWDYPMYMTPPAPAEKETETEAATN